MGYFDDAFNSTGTLTARLASDASKVQVIYRPCFDLISNSLIISGSNRCPFGYIGAEHRCFRMCVYHSILFWMASHSCLPWLYPSSDRLNRSYDVGFHWRSCRQRKGCFWRSRKVYNWSYYECSNCGCLRTRTNLHWKIFCSTWCSSSIIHQGNGQNSFYPALKRWKLRLRKCFNESILKRNHGYLVSCTACQPGLFS